MPSVFVAFDSQCSDLILPLKWCLAYSLFPDKGPAGPVSNYGGIGDGDDDDDYGDTSHHVSLASKAEAEMVRD